MILDRFFKEFFLRKAQVIGEERDVDEEFLLLPFNSGQVFIQLARRGENVLEKPSFAHQEQPSGLGRRQVWGYQSVTETGNK